MAHPIEGLWKVVVSFDGPDGVARENRVVIRYAPDGTVIIDTGLTTALGLWEAVDEQTAKTTSVAPMITGTFMEREFHGWLEIDGTVTVDESGDAFTSTGDFVLPSPDGTETRGTGTSRGERVTFR